ncbi:MAG: amidohydrolase family protein [Nanoarchaeota archaeon]|nr:amidohydrolase family protein [Nanoarchaeota archaeon]
MQQLVRGGLVVVFFLFLFGCASALPGEDALEIQDQPEKAVVVPEETIQNLSSPAAAEKEVLAESKSAEVSEELTPEQQLWKPRIDKALAPTVCPPIEKQIYPDTYYQGPLIDTHLHIPALPDWGFEDGEEPALDEAPEGRFGGPQALLGWNVQMSDIACTLQHEGTHKNFAFFPVYEGEISLPLLETWNKTMKEYPELFTPFIMSSGDDNEPDGFPTVDARILQNMLAVYPHLFAGYGEIGLYARENGGSPELPPDSSRLQEIYPLIKKYDLVVYFHLGDGHKDTFEKVLEQYPEITFIWHGDQLSVQEVDTVLRKHPNAYYGIDEFFGGDHDTFLLYVGKSKEGYLETMNRNFYAVINRAVQDWKALIERHPNQVSWGTDRGDAVWNYDRDIGLMQVKIARAFIGRLDPAVQEKFAYQNAERLSSQ